MSIKRFQGRVGVTSKVKTQAQTRRAKSGLAVPFVCGFNSAATGVAAGFNSYDSVSPEAEGVHSLRLVFERYGKEIRDDRR